MIVQNVLCLSTVPVEKPRNLRGFASRVVETVELLKAKLPQLPPIGLGTGVGFGCGLGLGWKFDAVRKEGLHPPRAFVGCGVGIAIIGIGYGQGWGWYLTKDRRSLEKKDSLLDVGEYWQFINED
eukprot:jgi/Galph1/60/GphlegSOOS_G4828.1